MPNQGSWAGVDALPCCAAAAKAEEAAAVVLSGDVTTAGRFFRLHGSFETAAGPLPCPCVVIRHRLCYRPQVPAANGQSLQVWHDYFAHAHIWGFDVVRDKVRAAKQLFSGAPRMHLFASSSTSARAMHNTGLAMGSMDVVIDDGDHYAGSMDKTLQVVWPYLRAGGYYIVEDVATGANFGTRLDYHKRNRYPGGYSPLVHNASFLSEVRVLRAPSVQSDDR